MCVRTVTTANIVSIWMVALVIGVSGSRPIMAQPAGFGRTLAGITAGVDTLDRVRSLYGSGAANTVDKVTSLCYHLSAQQAYLTASTFQGQNRIQRIVLTTLSSVDPGCHDARATAAHVATGPRGITLGESFERVVATLGQPSRTGTLPAGEKPLRYADYAIEGGHASCQFQDDKLVLIALELD